MAVKLSLHFFGFFAFVAMPDSAYVNEGECSFEKDMCNWKNTTGDLVYRWQLATITRRPANLPDKTFGAPGSIFKYGKRDLLEGEIDVRKKIDKQCMTCIVL